MVAALVIPDGAAEPVRAGEPTALERSRTPALDALAAAGAVVRVATTPPGLTAGSETGIPALLGAPPVSAVARGALEAAAYEIDVPAGQRAWRIDLRRADGERSSAEEARAAVPALRAALPQHAVRHLRGHRCLAIGDGPPPVDGPLAVAVAPRRGDAGTSPASGVLRAHVWPDGAGLPPVLDEATVVVCARGAAAGCARLLGAKVVIPTGATGGVDTAWAAKRDAALRALDDGARVVVHAGAPDEAAHERDAAAKAGALEAIDRELVGPLWSAVASRGGRLVVCPDHGTDPRTGGHDPAPVPAVLAGHGVAADVLPARMTERAAAACALIAPGALWTAARHAGSVA